VTDSSVAAGHTGVTCRNARPVSSAGGRRHRYTDELWSTGVDAGELGLEHERRATDAPHDELSAAASVAECPAVNCPAAKPRTNAVSVACMRTGVVGSDFCIAGSAAR